MSCEKLIFVLLFITLQQIACDQLKDPVNYNGYTVVQVTPTSEPQLEKAKLWPSSKSLQFWRRPTAINNSFEIMIPAESKRSVMNKLRQDNYSYEVRIDDVGQILHAERVKLANPTETGNFFTDYRSYERILQFLADTSAANPDLCELVTIGYSYENRKIPMIKISRDLVTSTKPIVLIDCGIHAREWISPATCCYMIDRLTRTSDDQCRQLLDKFEFHIIPILNPDGYVYTFTSDRMWRKSRSLSPFSTCIGTDLNRNFDFAWSIAGASNNPCDETYCGSKPFSENESLALADHIRSCKDQILAYNTIHAYSQYWLVPWSHTTEKPDDYDELMRVMTLSANELKSVHGTEYAVGTATDLLYATSGSSDDWAKGECAIPYVSCMELRDTGRYGFLLPPNQIIPTGEETLKGLAAMCLAMKQRGQKVEKVNKQTDEKLPVPSVWMRIFEKILRNLAGN